MDEENLICVQTGEDPAFCLDLPIMNTRRHFITSLTAALGGSVFAADGKPKTIVLQSAWDTVNIGDIGHTPGTLRVIEEHLPEVKIVLWAMKLDERVTAMIKARFPKVEILQGNLFKDGEKDRKLQEAVKECDFFIRNSGMGQDITFMQFCQKIGKPYGLFGQSYFPSMVEGEGAKERIALLNGASFIYTRETKTLKILQGAGIKAAALQFGPDGCFGIDVRDDVRGLATMKKLGLEDRKFITIQLRTNTAKLPGVDDTRTPKLNPLHPTPEHMADDAAPGIDLLGPHGKSVQRLIRTALAKTFQRKKHSHIYHRQRSGSRGRRWFRDWRRLRGGWFVASAEQQQHCSQ